MLVERWGRMKGEATERARTRAGWMAKEWSGGSRSPAEIRWALCVMLVLTLLIPELMRAK